MLDALSHHLVRVVRATPWTRALGAARTLFAFNTLLTLVFNGDAELFPLDGSRLTANTCQGAASWGIFCTVGTGWGRTLSFIVLVAVLSGWFPRWTAIPQWYVAHSLASTIFTVEGGDQLVAVLTLVLIPAIVTDTRRNHWMVSDVEGRAVPAYVAHSAVFVARIQMSIVYLHASLGKLGSAEWVDGTALYYWLADPVFGASSWAAPAVGATLATPVGTAVLTWGTLLVEFALALGLFAGKVARRSLLVVGVGLHAGIAILMGLVTFALAMFGGLIIYLFCEEDWRRPSAPVREESGKRMMEGGRQWVAVTD